MVRARTDTAAVFKRLVASVPQNGSIAKLKGKSWRWAAGVHVFPEAICPWCNTVMRSTCLWVIDERAQKVKMVVSVDKRALVPLRISHPHVDGSTYICMGRARGVAQAIFMGMNPNDCMGGFGEAGGRNNRAWKNFFASYFGDHVHKEKAGRRPRLMAIKKSAPAVRKRA